MSGTAGSVCSIIINQGDSEVVKMRPIHYLFHLPYTGIHLPLTQVLKICWNFNIKGLLTSAQPASRPGALYQCCVGGQEDRSSDVKVLIPAPHIPPFWRCPWRPTQGTLWRCRRTPKASPTNACSPWFLPWCTCSSVLWLGFGTKERWNEGGKTSGMFEV